MVEKCQHLHISVREPTRRGGRSRSQRRHFDQRTPQQQADAERERAAAAVDGPGAFDEVEVFRAERDGVVFFVAALENAAAETAILVPAFYDTRRAENFLATVDREGELRQHVWPLDRRRVLTFAQSDPSPFLPD